VKSMKVHPEKGEDKKKVGEKGWDKQFISRLFHKNTNRMEVIRPSTKREELWYPCGPKRVGGRERKNTVNSILQYPVGPRGGV